MGAEDAVGREVAGRVQDAVPVRSLHRLVREGPQEGTGGPCAPDHQVPEVIQSRPEPAVVEPVQKLRREVDLVSREPVPQRGEVRVVLAQDPAPGGPGAQDRSPLGIMPCELPVQLRVPAALVAVVPEQDGRVVDVAEDHLAHDGLPHRRVVRRRLPARQLVQDVESQLVARVEEVRVGRVVRHPHGVHVHVLHQKDVAAAEGRARRASAVGPERVAIHPLEPDPAAVEVDPVVGTDLHRPEAEALLHTVTLDTSCREGHRDLVEGGGLRGPEPGVGHVGLEMRQALARTERGARWGDQQLRHRGSGSEPRRRRLDGRRRGD